jgi:DNA-binding response OmpR family regulator
VLDVMLPRMDGLAVCRALRGAPDPRLRTVPVLMLSARADETDKVGGLEAGADDYLTKPFAMRELQARVSALLRRSRRGAEVAGRGPETTPLVAGPAGELELELGQRQLRRRGKDVPLKPREFELLAFLLGHPDQVFTREQLLERVWATDGQPHIGDMRTVDVHVRWLREKIEPAPSRPVVLETVRGVGYRARMAGGLVNRPGTRRG